MKNRKTLLLILLCTSLHVYSFSYRYINTENGLSSNRVFQIEKDTTGFMWFVTYMGINRYDGSEIRNYKLSIQDTIEEIYFPSTKMVKDRDGGIWIVLYTGKVFRYNKNIDDFECMLDIRKDLHSDSHIISSVFFDEANRLWICSNMGLYTYTPRQELRFVRVFKDKNTYVVTQQNSHTYYVASNEGIYKIKEKIPDDYTIIEKNALPESSGPVTTMLCHEEYLYIGTESKSVFILDSKRNLRISLNPIIPNVPIRAIKRLADHHILVGTDGSGVYVVDTQTHKLGSSYVADDDVKDGLRGNTVYDIYVDNAGCLWIATYTNGITIIDPFSPEIIRTRHEYREPNSLINNHVNVIFEDSDGDLWYGTNNGISVYDTRKQRWKHFLDNQENKAVILCFCEDKDGNIWTGGYGVGAFRIDKQSGKIHSLLHQKGANASGTFDAYHIYAMYADDENLWLGSLDKSMIQYNLRTKSFNYHSIEAIGDIKPLNDSILLCGTANSLAVFNKNTHHYKEYLHIGQRIQNRAIRNIAPVSNKEIWMSTEGNGIICYNLESETSTSYTEKEGLKSNYIHSMKLDDWNRLWFTTNKGISYIDLKTRKVVSIGEYIGLNNLEYSYHIACKRKNGNLVFGTTDGAVEFSAQQETDIQLESKLIITDFKLFYNSVKAKDEGSPLKQAINETSAFSLAYDQNSFSFAFSSVNFHHQHLISYVYKLEGFDNEWYAAPENNIISYTNINPGKYTFRLRALNKDNKEIIDERELDIEVARPYWESGWAWAVYLLLFAILLRFIIQYAQNKMDKRYSKEKIRFFVNVAHDIRTPVSLIKGPLNDLGESEALTEKGKTSLYIAVKNTEKLFQMVSQLLDFEKADLSALRLIVSPNELAEYIQEKISFFNVEAKHKQIYLTYDIGFDSLSVWFDREKMDKIVNNILSNAIKYTKEGGQVHIKVCQDDKNWSLIVSDTGIGIPASEQKHLFKSFFRAKNAINSKETGSGIGLLLTKKLVKLHKGEISFSSKEGIGTEFRLTFPKGDQYFMRGNKLTEYQGSDYPKVQVIPREAEQQEKQSQKVTILVAEDNDDMRLFLKNSLSTDYHVVEASNGEEAMNMALQLNPDIIVCDIMMPVLNGDAVCSRIKTSVETSHIPFILLTALADKEDIIKGLDCGADDYITKPFDISILKARIRNLLANRKKIREALLSDNPPAQDVTYTNTLDREFMEKILALIDECMEDPEFSINNLCAKLGMSRSSLYNKLKALTDQAPNDFIRIIRLKKAAELLRSRRYNISEVAAMTGFPDSSYFSTAFKRQYGMSPRKYLSEEPG